MSFRAIVYAYVIGGFTFIPLVVICVLSIALYTSVPIDTGATAADTFKSKDESDEKKEPSPAGSAPPDAASPPSSPGFEATSDANDLPRRLKGWLTMRRTFEESALDGSYYTLMRSFLDARSKDPKRSRPKDMWYVVLKGTVLFLYEDEGMTECEAAVELGGHDVFVYPQDLPDGELFSRRNAICLRPKVAPREDKATAAAPPPSEPKKVSSEGEELEDGATTSSSSGVSGGLKKRASTHDRDREGARAESQRRRAATKEGPSDLSTPWFIFVRTITEMEDWYFALVHASDHAANTPTLAPLRPVFEPAHMEGLVSTIDAQPDVIPMRWLNALLGRIFFSYYQTQVLETFMIGRIMKKLSKVKRPAFLTDIVVTEVSLGSKAPTFSKPMLKELTKEGDAALEVHLFYKGEIRITVEATATINLGARFKSYTVKLVLAAVLKELEGNLLIKVKRPPSNRIWYAFTQTPRMVLAVEPIVSDRQITWSMILSTIEARVKEIIQESVVMPNMDDIAFFDSDSYQHRGGIWADASRRKRTPTTMQVASSPDPASSFPTESQEVSSSAQADSAPMSPPRTHTADELMSGSDPTPLDLTPRPVTLSGGEDISTFEQSGVVLPNIIQAALRTDRDDERADGTAARRGSSGSEGPGSQSSPEDRDVLQDAAPPFDDATMEGSELLGSPPSVRQASSQVSPAPSTRRHSMATSSEDGMSLSTWTLGSATLGPPTTPPPQKSSPRPVSGSPSNASTFLASLKARAGDTEALSKTAKEAMRKWGVNWTGLRRDSFDRADDMLDPNATDDASRSRTDSTSGTLAQKARAGYAEMRAAVAEWKDGVKESRTDGTASIPIGGLARRESRGGSRSPSARQSWSPGSTPEQSEPSDVEHATLVPPPLSSRSRTPSRTSDAQNHVLPPTVIHTQQPLQAKTMAIPGIHASHRGEVMAMGYVAPPAPAPEGRPKRPAIESMYRLWKGSLPNTPQSGSSQEAALETPKAGESGDGGENRGTLLADHTPSVAHDDGPPPLPPRSLSVKTLQPDPRHALAPSSLPEAPTAARIEEPRGFLPEEVDQSPTSTDQPLAHEVNKGDTVIEAQSEQRELKPVVSFPPPLPPRKISMSIDPTRL